MLTKQTLEVRWFNEGQIPANIQNWFWNECPGQLEQSIESPEEREDDYLYLPKCQILSFKFRQDNLEIKWRKDELDLHNFFPDWKGKVERWLKLEYDPDLIQIKGNSDHEQNPTWITVKKQRWQRFYQDVELEIGYLEIGKASWWTMAAEMEESNSNSQQHFNQVIQAFSQTYSGEKLSPEESYGYPNWLLQNMSDN